MEHFKVLKRAFDTTWNYKALWVFGILIALTAGGGGFSGGGSNPGMSSGGNGNGDIPFPHGGERFEYFPQAFAVLFIILLAVIVLAVLFWIVATIARHVADNALIQMVNEHEETGARHTVGGGFRLGWSRPAWRLFLVDLVVGLPGVVISLLFLVLAAMPLLLLFTRDAVFSTVGILAALGIFLPGFFLLTILGVVVGLLRPFFHRTCVLEGLGVFASIRQGFEVVRRHLGDVVIMWLIMVGVSLAWMVVLIPVMLLLMLVGALVAGIPALLVGAFVHLLFSSGAAPWILGALVGLPIFMLVVGLPSLFLGGLFETFKSTTWTLTYREILQLS